MKPNLFSFATSELSQDAIIAWLCQWADDNCAVSDKDLNYFAKKFIIALIRKQDPSFSKNVESIKSSKVYRQWNNIDIVVEVNDDIFLIIEDKTNTEAHSNQLERYYQLAKEYSDKKNRRLFSIYFKSGNESNRNYQKYEKVGFGVFDKSDFIDLYESDSINNNILTDFIEYLKYLKSKVNEFQTKPIKQWAGNDFLGFMSELEKILGFGSYNYVNNPSGGFWGYIISWQQSGQFPVYLAFQNATLCYKVSVAKVEGVNLAPNQSPGSIRSFWHSTIINSAKKNQIIGIRKPARFGNGNYMTVAEVDYNSLLAGPDGLLLPWETVKDNIMKHIEFLKATIKEIN